jgi:hypothetical protein
MSPRFFETRGSGTNATAQSEIAQVTLRLGSGEAISGAGLKFSSTPMIAKCHETLSLISYNGESFFYDENFLKIFSFMVTIVSYVVLLMGALGFTLTIYLGLLKGVKLI